VPPLQDIVVVYSGTARSFRTTLIGYLFEITQKHQTYLLCEELDPSTLSLLENRALFPNLGEVIPVRQFSASPMNRWSRVRLLCRTARDTIDRLRPKVVIATSDNDSLFEMFLMRFARRAGSLTVSVSCTLTYPDTALVRRYIDLTNVHDRTPAWLPLTVRRWLVAARKYAGHAVLYWAMPTWCGEWPFWGLTSHVLQRGHNGMRDARLQVVMHEKDFATYRNRGVPAEKLVILPHPFLRAAGERLGRRVTSKKRERAVRRALLLLPENRVSFHRGTYRLFSPREVFEMRCAALNVAFEELTAWEFLVKPHPLVADHTELERYCVAKGYRIEFLPKADPVEDLIAEVDLVIELPRSGSTALFYGTICAPMVPKIALNLRDEFYADYYRDCPGVAYVTSLEQMRAMLQQIRNGSAQASAWSAKVSQSADDICSLVLDPVFEPGRTA